MMKASIDVEQVWSHCRGLWGYSQEGGEVCQGRWCQDASRLLVTRCDNW